MAPLLLALGATLGPGGRWWCPICQSAGKGKHASPDLFAGPHWVKCHKCGAGGGWLRFLRAAGIAQPVEYAREVYFGSGSSGVRPELRSITPPPPRPPRCVASYHVVTDEMERGGWACADVYAYGDAAVVLRFERGAEKTFRQATWNGQSWSMSGPPPPVPLYRGKNPQREPNAGAWFVVEGEKCVDAVRACGLRGACSIGGARNAGAGDWSPLHGGRVIIMPDNDDAGRLYARDVEKLLSPNADVRVHRLPVPTGGDVADLVEAVGVDTVRQYLEKVERNQKEQ